MKKVCIFIICFFLLCSLAGCAGNSEVDNKENFDGSSSENKDNKMPGENVLIVYFSMPETTSPENMTQEEENSAVIIDGKVLGNTQYVAQVIQENTSSELFRIEPETPYPTDHETLVDMAQKEQNDESRPRMKDKIDNFEEYDTVFIGYPNWWGDMPMIMYSFFEEYDFSDKRIIPFNTHGGSGFSNTIETISDLEPNATVDSNGFTVSRDDVENSKEDIIQWINDLGIAK